MPLKSKIHWIPLVATNIFCQSVLLYLSRLILANLKEPPDTRHIISIKNAFGFKLLLTHSVLKQAFCNTNKIYTLILIREMKTLSNTGFELALARLPKLLV